MSTNNIIKAHNVLKKLYSKYPNNSDIINSYVKANIFIGNNNYAIDLIKKHSGIDVSKNFKYSHLDLILHPGAHKTATTFVQNTFAENESLLSSNGFSYIPLHILKGKFNIKQNFTEAYESLDTLLSTYVKEDTNHLIFSEENLLSAGGEFKQHIYGRSKTQLIIFNFYITRLFNIKFSKVVFAVRNYSEFFQSMFFEINRHEFLETKYINKKLLYSFSWLKIVKDLIDIFGKNKVKVVFFEDIKKNDIAIFEQFINDPSIYNSLLRSSIRRKSPNSKAYFEVVKLYKSDLEPYTKDFLKTCLMYPHLLQDAFNNYHYSNAGTRRILNHNMYHLHTEKLNRNLLLDDNEIKIMNNKYEKDKLAIIDLIG